MKAIHHHKLFAAWLAFLAVGIGGLTASTALAQVSDGEAVVHLRTYYTEPYLKRASLRTPEERPFNSVWVTSKFQPGSEDGGDPASQAIGIKKQMEFARNELQVDAQGGYVLHPTAWLSPSHWERRAKALERVIIDAELSGVIALDIEGYEYDGVSNPPPSANNKELQDLLTEACRPIVDVLKRHNLSAIIYPAGGRGFEDYTAAAIALGATKFGDEYSFIFSEKLAQENPLTKEDWRFWREYISSADPANSSVPTIPGFLASMLKDKQDLRILRGLDVVEAWLYVDDKNWLLKEAPRESSTN